MTVDPTSRGKKVDEIGPNPNITALTALKDNLAEINDNLTGLKEKIDVARTQLANLQGSNVLKGSKVDVEAALDKVFKAVEDLQGVLDTFR